MKPFLKYHLKDRAVLTRDKVHFRMSVLQPLLVFTMAKVGSLSVHLSVKRSTNIPSFHIHSLDIEEIRTMNQRCFERGLYPDSRSPVPFILKNIIEKNRPYKVISLFRNPIERNISAFFDAFELHVGTFSRDFKGELDSLVNTFHQRVDHEYPLRWYEQHLKAATGIDVYAHEFDKELGVGQVKVGDCSLLLLNSTVNDHVKETLIADFLQEPGFKLINTNITGESGAADLYQKFKSHIRFDRGYMDEMLNSDFFRHFFTEREAERSINQWLKT